MKTAPKTTEAFGRTWRRIWYGDTRTAERVEDAYRRLYGRQCLNAERHGFWPTDAERRGLPVERYGDGMDTLLHPDLLLSEGYDSQELWEPA